MKCVTWDKTISGYDTVYFHVKLYISRFCYFNCCCVALTSNTKPFKHVSDKVPRAKWPHGTSGNTMFLPNLDFSIGFLPFESRFFSYPPFVFFLSNQFILQEVCFLCIQYIQYIRYILTFLIYFSEHLLLKCRWSGTCANHD